MLGREIVVAGLPPLHRPYHHTSLSNIAKQEVSKGKLQKQKYVS